MRCPQGSPLGASVEFTDSREPGLNTWGARKRKSTLEQSSSSQHFPVPLHAPRPTPCPLVLSCPAARG